METMPATFMQFLRPVCTKCTMMSEIPRTSSETPSASFPKTKASPGPKGAEKMGTPPSRVSTATILLPVAPAHAAASQVFEKYLHGTILWVPRAVCASFLFPGLADTPQRITAEGDTASAVLNADPTL